MFGQNTEPDLDMLKSNVDFLLKENDTLSLVKYIVNKVINLNHTTLAHAHLFHRNYLLGQRVLNMERLYMHAFL